MNEQVRKKMHNDYLSLSYVRKGTCVKYIYKYNNVFVNLYFDAYDPNSYSLIMILSAEKQFYFSTLNIMNTRIRKEYLPELPYIFLEKILVNNELDTFYQHMENKILEATPITTSYRVDKIFLQTIKYQKDIDLPFLWHLRKAHMTDTTLEELNERANISRQTLLAIQRKGFTLVRTADINKRRSLKIILDEHRISL